MKKLIILFLLLPSLLFSQVSPSKIERIADANTVFGNALSYGTYLVVQSNNKTYKIISVNGVAGTAKLSDLVLNTDYIEEGSVTAVSTAAANNGVTATWSMASPTPALTIGLGAITPTSVNGLTLTALAAGFTVAGGTTSKTLTVPLDASVSGTNTGDQTNIAGNAATVTTNADLTGEVTSVGNAATLGSFTSLSLKTALTDETGSGAAVFATSPTFITPILGTPTSGIATNLTGTAAGLTAGNVTTNADLTGPITSVGNATSIASQTGTGTTFVMNTSPTLVTPVLGVATATSINGNTITTGTGTLTLAAGKTLTASNTLTLTGTDGSSVAFGTGGTVAYTANNLSVFAATTSAQLAGVLSDETGSGAAVFGTSPTFVTPALGTPASGIATNLTGTAAGLTAGNVTTNADLTGPITSVGNATSIASQTGTGTTFVMNTSPTLVTPVLGVATATSINGNTITTGTGTLTLAAGKTLTASNTLTLTGTDGSSVAFGTGGTVAYTENNLSVFAATTSAELAGVLSDETGSGAAVFGTSPILSTPEINGTITGTTVIPVANGGTGQSSVLVAGGVLYGSSTTVAAVTAAGSTGQILQSAGAGIPTFSTATYPSTAGAAGNILRSDGTNFVSTAVTTGQTTVANPAGTTSGVGVMMGLAGAITPVRSGNILIIISGDIDNNTTGDGGRVQIRYGTGAAPANAAALTGTAVGGLVTLTGVRTGAWTYPFSTNAIVTGLTVNTAVWVDVSLVRVTGGTVSINNVSISIIEL